ncbi:MAG: helix-turn-helix domain-containing protein [Alphaproteobacteria bacterium]|nr:helix-turn-helix domain-containing protein [Alphaproteobacteria bacterium]
MVKQVRALERGLDLLEVLNENDGADIAWLAERADLPRGTAYRMMETLIAKGFVAKGSNAATYWLTRRVRALSDGYGAESLMVQTAGPFLDQLCEKTQWPVSLTLPLGIKMVVRAHTDASTPLVLVKIPIGHSVSMINSAAGLAYLANCTEHQRTVLLDLIFESPATDAFEQALRDRAVVDTVIRETREQGYSFLATDGTHAAMGVPILLDDQPVAALSVRYFTSAISKFEAAKLHLKWARETATGIAESWLEAQNQS